MGDFSLTLYREGAGICLASSTGDQDVDDLIYGPAKTPEGVNMMAGDFLGKLFGPRSLPARITTATANGKGLEKISSGLPSDLFALDKEGVPVSREWRLPSTSPAGVKALVKTAAEAALAAAKAAAAALGDNPVTATAAGVEEAEAQLKISEDQINAGKAAIEKANNANFSPVDNIPHQSSGSTLALPAVMALGLGVAAVFCPPLRMLVPLGAAAAAAALGLNETPPPDDHPLQT